MASQLENHFRLSTRRNVDVGAVGVDSEFRPG